MDKKRLSANYIVAAVLVLLFLIQSINCSSLLAEDVAADKINPTEELLLGTWSRYNNKVYTLLIVRANGNWSSDLRVEGATSKIIERKGEATGTWHLKKNSLAMTVATSEMPDIWPVGEIVLEIVEIDEKSVTVKYPNSRLITWKKARVEKEKKSDDANITTVNPIITMKPIVINLNKISSNDKDRYLCLALEIHLQEMELTAEVPKLHPRAWEASIIFLSSLLYNDVKTFDAMKVVTDKLTKIINPYFDGMVTEVASTHVMVSSSLDKVDEFIIEHSPPPALETTDAESSDKDKKEEENKAEESKDKESKEEGKK